ncbi:MAG TPA: tRNA (adenosine(37)-N6)-threonylcarbamoyltransferase complex dimerization subunit type 1 TsaB [Candidatus Cybelea sp.]|nr:tRNA (adenosine(37)-N6)-threonylcarbamoyltransferase complex dimerization subunit type 1 TsaB [Candidatus Cybelea sp.]
MNILAFDTALGACSVAVVEDGRARAVRRVSQARGQAESLLPLILEALKDSGLAWSDLDLLAVTVGPGTFTGLRVGLAAARGMSLAAKIPAVGVTTLEALAEGVPAGLRARCAVLAAIDARRGEVYAQAFDGALRPLKPPALLDYKSAAALPPVGPVALVGSGAYLLAAHLAPREVVPDAGPADPDPLAIAAVAARRGIPAPGAPAPAPLYLRAPDARLPEPRR